MFEKNHEIPRELIQSLSRECQYQREYIHLIEDEKTALQSMKSYNIEECTARRESMIARIKREQDFRIEVLKGILKRIPRDRPELKLMAVADRVFHVDDSRLIKENCGILKELILLTKRKTRELEGIVSFSMNLVSGSLAAILTHAQVQTPVYNSLGKVSTGSKSNVSGNHHMSRVA